jgi:hypothetical protein
MAVGVVESFGLVNGTRGNGLIIVYYGGKIDKASYLALIPKILHT